LFCKWRDALLSKPSVLRSRRPRVQDSPGRVPPFPMHATRLGQATLRPGCPTGRKRARQARLPLENSSASYAGARFFDAVSIVPAARNTDFQSVRPAEFYSDDDKRKARQNAPCSPTAEWQLRWAHRLKAYVPEESNARCFPQTVLGIVSVVQHYQNVILFLLTRFKQQTKNGQFFALTLGNHPLNGA
jgi:hypothetical protein